MCTFIWCEWEVKPGYDVTITLVVLLGVLTILALSVVQQVCSCFPGGPWGWDDTSVWFTALFGGRACPFTWQMHSLLLTSTSLLTWCISSDVLWDVPDLEKSPAAHKGCCSVDFSRRKEKRSGGTAAHSLPATPQPSTWKEDTGMVLADAVSVP